MKKPLAHLSQKEIETLISRYYKEEKVSVLIKDYSLKIKPTQLVKLFPPKVSHLKCPYCKINLTSQYHSRGARKEKPKCSKCDYSELSI